MTGDTTERRYHHGDLRRALLEAAARLARETGSAEVSLREVARRVGVSHNAPYKHFPDKGALQAALAAFGFETLEAELRAALADGLEGAEALRRAGIAYVRFAQADPARYRLMFAQAPDPGVEAAALKARGALEAALSAAGRSDIAALLAAWSLVHGLASLSLSGASRDLAGADEAALSAALEPLIAGLTRSR